MTPPVFTVVMTVLKRVELLPHALQTIAWQTFPEWELVILEDGKHPFARGVFNSFPRYAPHIASRIRYVECNMPDGIAGPWGHALRRKGLQEARGQYICWMNHDNLLHPDFLQLHYENTLQADPCISLVSVDYWQGHHFVQRRPFTSEPASQLKPGDLDLLSLCLPVKDAVDVEAFDEKYDDVKEAGYHAYERLAGRLPVYLARSLGGAHF